MTCPQYAYTPKILEVLFRKIRLVASPEHVSRLESTDFSFLAPLVRRIDFDPGLQSFKVRREYKASQERTEKTRELYDSGRLHAAWVKALRSLPHAEIFRLGKGDFELEDEEFRFLREEMDPDFIRKESEDNYDGREIDGRTFQQPACEAMVKAAFLALADAQTNVKHLIFDAVPDGDFSWADNGLLHGVDLSEMETLIFKPFLQRAGERIWSKKKRRDVEWRCGLAATVLLERSYQTLKYVELLTGEDSCLATFSGERLGNFPKLESCVIGDRMALELGAES